MKGFFIAGGKIFLGRNPMVFKILHSLIGVKQEMATRANPNFLDMK